jgi:hypothetical protein
MIPQPTGRGCGVHGCGLRFRHTNDELVGVMKFYPNINTQQAHEILNDLKSVYRRHKLDWDKTSEGICKLK